MPASFWVLDSVIKLATLITFSASAWTSLSVSWSSSTMAAVFRMISAILCYWLAIYWDGERDGDSCLISSRLVAICWTFFSMDSLLDCWLRPSKSILKGCRKASSFSFFCCIIRWITCWAMDEPSLLTGAGWGFGMIAWDFGTETCFVASTDLGASFGTWARFFSKSTASLKSFWDFSSNGSLDLVGALISAGFLATGISSSSSSSWIVYYARTYGLSVIFVTMPSFSLSWLVWTRL